MKKREVRRMLRQFLKDKINRERYLEIKKAFKNWGKIPRNKEGL